MVMKVLMPYMLTMPRCTNPRLNRSKSRTSLRLARGSSRSSLRPAFSDMHFRNGNGFLLVYQVIRFVDDHFTMVAVDVTRLFRGICKVEWQAVFQDAHDVGALLPVCTDDILWDLLVVVDQLIGIGAVALRWPMVIAEHAIQIR